MDGKNIKVIWDKGVDVPPMYANQLFVSHAGYEDFHLVFGHLEPVNTINLEESEMPDKAVVKTVSKIVITPDMMGKVVEAINKNYEEYLKVKGDENVK